MNTTQLQLLPVLLLLLRDGDITDRLHDNNGARDKPRPAHGRGVTAAEWSGGTASHKEHKR